MSLLSVAEFVYWLMRSGRKLFVANGNGKRKQQREFWAAKTGGVMPNVD